METERNCIALASIQTLFGSGTTGGLTDAQLLDRYLSLRGTRRAGFRGAGAPAWADGVGRLSKCPA